MTPPPLHSARTTGAFPSANGTTFRLWAPRARHVDLLLYPTNARHPTPIIPLLPEPGGGGDFFSLSLSNIPDGQNYAFRLNKKLIRPDPCSLFQPLGLPGPSAFVRTDTFRWTDSAWRGIPRRDLVLYELHVGAFTPEGTFDAAIARLPALRDLGITAIELMPVAQFSGDRNWGYDGVLPFATQDSYGGPHALARLVDAAHNLGLAVLLDVVYNHFGPEHNYLEDFGPYLTDRHHTPWGKAVNFDGDDAAPVRDFVIENVRMWLQEFHFDGLRLDAAHAIVDSSQTHILQEAQHVASEIAAVTGRHIHLIAEAETHSPQLLLSPEQTPGGCGLAAQWADDFHHSLHACLTGERRAYYRRYGTAQHLATAFEKPFITETARHPDLTPDRFVACIQNHDQVGNRAIGDRLSAILPPEQLRLAAAMLLLSPYIPLLFMGEEYAEPNPFPFFCSFTGESLIRAVREGRKREFADFIDTSHEIPLPDSPETYRSAILSWQWERSAQAGLRHLYTDLLHARRPVGGWRELQYQSPITAPVSAHVLPNNLLRVNRSPTLTLYFNLSKNPHPLPTGQLKWSSESEKYAGRRTPSTSALLPYEALAIVQAPPPS